MVQRSLFTSISEEWETPRSIFQALDAEFGFTLDPCSTHENAKCKLHFTAMEDGLVQNWTDHIVFMNPPYGRAIGKWMQKAYSSARGGATVVCLVPARTDTRWWHRFAMKGEIRLLRGRVRFVGGKHSAPFPTAVVVFRPRQHQLTAADVNRCESKAGRKSNKENGSWAGPTLWGD
jgi:site-specific DNA-methyltransferase (adenine-specific)